MALSAVARAGYAPETGRAASSARAVRYRSLIKIYERCTPLLALKEKEQ